MAVCDGRLAADAVATALCAVNDGQPNKANVPQGRGYIYEMHSLTDFSISLTTRSSSSMRSA